nr:Sulfate starvation-induced protein 2 [Klebsiella pneumoniae]
MTPSESILAEPTVSVVDKVVDKKGTRQVAEAYLKYLYSPEGRDCGEELLPPARSECGEEIC